MAITDAQIAADLTRIILNGGGVQPTISGTPQFATRVRSLGSITVPDGTRMAVVLETNVNGAAATSGWVPLINGPTQLAAYDPSVSSGAAAPGHASLVYANAVDPGGAAALVRLRAIGAAALQGAGVPAGQIAQV